MDTVEKLLLPPLPGVSTAIGSHSEKFARQEDASHFCHSGQRRTRPHEHAGAVAVVVRMTARAGLRARYSYS